MHESTSELVAVSLEQGVLTIQMNRPAKRNALNLEMYRAMSAALRDGGEDPTVRAVLFTGTGKCFSSGNDIMDFVGNPPADDNHPVVQFLFALVDFEKPMIAAVNGPAVGIGTTMLLHCDLAYAAEDALFQLPFVNLSLCPEAGSSLLLPMRAGSNRAAEAILLGQPFDAPTALSWGIVNAVTPSGQAETTALEVARCLTQKPPAALRTARKLLREPYLAPLREAMTREAAAFLQCLASPESAEAFQAFMERRPPDFSKFS